MQRITLMRDEGQNNWHIVHEPSEAAVRGGDRTSSFLVNDGTGLTDIVLGTEQAAGETIRTLELIVQAYNGTHVGGTA